MVSRMKTLPGTGGVPVPESSRIPLSLYIHWPWCVRKCPYCDFNSRPVMGALPTETYVSLLLRDLESQLEYLRPEDVLRRSISAAVLPLSWQGRRLELCCRESGI